MRVAALYDVHGTRNAHDAVLAEVPENDEDIFTEPYEDGPGAYWTLLGPGIEHRCAAYGPDTGDWPFELPTSSREEAVAFFETRAVGA
jgi:hypothetical protein